MVDPAPLLHESDGVGVPVDEAAERDEDGDGEGGDVLVPEDVGAVHPELRDAHVVVVDDASFSDFDIDLESAVVVALAVDVEEEAIPHFRQWQQRHHPW